ncbi:RHS repeat-associated core domain-containing protein [Neobacillus sp. SM06]|uniref:RHS repeat-associated core domain-containing protein n=1 Tax=Neobacillus sp. SM06 TaxID=3422492 RepID=UPI003D2B8EB2
MDGTTIAFQYDAVGNRTKKTVTQGSTSTTTDYTYDAANQLAAVNGQAYTYDANGNIVAQYQYDAWGNIISSTGTMKDANPYRYAGYRYDNETGLYYLMARYYDPNVGRFITRDTFQGFQNDPLSLNQYVYTNNNPVMNIDPTGNFAINLGFNSYIKIGWRRQVIRFSIKLTYGFIVSTGISFAVGGGAGYFALRYLNNYFFPILINFIAARVASEIIKRASGTLSKYTFKKVSKGRGWLSKSALNKSFNIPNFIFRR